MPIRANINGLSERGLNRWKRAGRAAKGKQVRHFFGVISLASGWFIQGVWGRFLCKDGCVSWAASSGKAHVSAALAAFCCARFYLRP